MIGDIDLPSKKKTDTWKQVQERSLMVQGQDLANFRWDPADLKVAQAMLAGANTVPDLAVETGIKPTQLRHRLLDPVRCAWLSKQLETCVGDRLGQVMAAVYNRALRSGDPQAASLLLKQYGKFAPEQKEVKVTHTMDLSGMTEEQIDQLIEQKKRNLNIKDAEFKVKDTPSDE